jgi:PKD repeat protein
MAIVRWYWDFGDGFYSFKQNPEHIYKRAGVYTVALTVWDDAGNTDTETKTAYITVTDPNLTREDTCLRFATQESEGEGWSLREGDDWVQPEDNWGAFTIIDENDCPRQIVMDANDGWNYELDTYDRINDIEPPAVNKEGVEDSEIEAEIHTPEHVVAPGKENKSLLHDCTVIGIEPSNPAHRGETGYTASGLRDAQAVSVTAYVNGEKETAKAQTENTPEFGENVFSGVQVQAHKIQNVIGFSAGEAEVASIVDKFVASDRAGDFTERTMTEHTYQLAFAKNMVVHLARGSNLLLNRVTGVALSGSYTGITGPDGRSGSAFLLATALNLENSAIAGDYTIMMWAKTAAPGPVTGTVLAQYGTTVSGWRLLYNRGAGGVAGNRTIVIGTSVFNPRIYNGTIVSDDMLLAYYNDVVRNAGAGYLPA